MFIWDFIAGDILGQIMDWVYLQLVGFLGGFFSAMGNLGADLFDLPWVHAIQQFFYYFGWALYAVGLIIAVFECAIHYNAGQGVDIKGTAMGAIRGFIAVNLFTTVPVELYKLSITMQKSFTAGITNIGGGGATAGELATGIIDNLKDTDLSTLAGTNTFGGFEGGLHPLLGIFLVILMGYAVIKVFFANLKRGGILLIQIAVGSLYMFGLPCGKLDAFLQWCRGVIALCLTAFLQVSMLTAGLMILPTHGLLGLGVMLASGEISQVAGTFGMDTSVRASMSSAVYSANSAMNLMRKAIP